MERSTLTLTCLASLIILSSALAQWDVPQVTRFTDTDVPLKPATQALVMDRDGWLHAVWMQYDFGTQGYDVLYSTNRPDSVWAEPVPVNLNAEPCFEAELQIDPLTNQPVVAYQSFDDLKLASWNGAEWEREVIHPGDVSVTYSPSLAIDSSSVAHVCWVNFVSDGEYSLAYRVMQEGSTTRILEDANLGEFGGGALPRLAVTPEGAAHIAYRNGGDGTSQVNHAWNEFSDDTNWSYEEVNALAQQEAFPSISVTVDGNVHLAMIGNNGFTLPAEVYYRFKANGFWSDAVEVTSELDSLSWSYPVLYVDHTGRPHIVSSEVLGSVPLGGMAYSQRQDDGTWQSMLIATADWSYPGFVVDQSLYGHLMILSGYNSPQGDFDFWLARSSVPLVSISHLSASPGTLEFGTVLLGEGATLPLLIQNTGSVDVTVAEIVAPLDYFTDFSDPVALVPNEALTVNVTFAPLEVGNRNGTLQVNSDASNSPSFVLLAGSGAKPTEGGNSGSVPSGFGILDCYPNPFNPATSVSFYLSRAEHVRLAVYDVTGREVTVLANGVYDAGAHHTMFDATEHSPGTYFVSLQSVRAKHTQKILLLK